MGKLIHDYGDSKYKLSKSYMITLSGIDYGIPVTKKVRNLLGLNSSNINYELEHLYTFNKVNYVSLSYIKDKQVNYVLYNISETQNSELDAFFDKVKKGIDLVLDMHQAIDFEKIDVDIEDDINTLLIAAVIAGISVVKKSH